MSEEQKKNEWCKTCVFCDDCEDKDEFLKSDEEECEFYV